ncbi:MAG: hypothetical protein M3P27_04745 [Acidobacteriota bacterium]|nr:hypothetical protein [Acidobacteriota bacterium]
MTMTLPRSVRIGALLFGCFALLRLVESAWIAWGPRWSAAAGAWAAMHPAGTVPKQIAASFAMLALASCLTRGYRWAWFLSVTGGTVLCGFGLAVLALATIPGSLARGFVTSHPAEAGAGAAELVCLGGAVSCLLRRDAREFFRK